MNFSFHLPTASDTLMAMLSTATSMSMAGKGSNLLLPQAPDTNGPHKLVGVGQIPLGCYPHNLHAINNADMTS